MGLLAAGGMACGRLADEEKLPRNVPDPESVQTPAGAVARYNGALGLLAQMIDQFAMTTAILTDELANLPAVVSSVYSDIDSRTDPAVGFEDTYNRLHHVRGQVREARGFVTDYAPDSSSALAGHLYALEGYAEVLLADLFCSGIPLSTVDFNGDYTLAAGSTTGDVYHHALALFDSALALSGDSLRLQRLAAVGRGRTLLALGRYAEAAEAVAAVPDDYAYWVQQRTGSVSLLILFRGMKDTLPAMPSMADNEGINGINYRSSGDPRTPALASGNDVLGNTYYFPNKYGSGHEGGSGLFSGNPIIRVADGVEARLIEAEAALRANTADGLWLAKLNHLRQTAMKCTRVPVNPPIVQCAPFGLPDLSDPGTDAEGTNAPRVNLLFRERAFWLYLTGHRQGDLRRLVREYFRDQGTVYPIGLYQGAKEAYGEAIVAPVPMSEQLHNKRYTGCFNLGA